MSLQPDVLSKALDKVGANRWMRKKYYECSMVQCLGNVFQILNEDGEYQELTTVTQRFGSSVEGTTTCGMRSDIDEIDVELNEVIEEGLEGNHVKTAKTIVLVTDLFTPPGFVKMKVDEGGRYNDFILEKDLNGNCFLSNIYTDDYKQHMADLLQVGQDPSDLEKHGPALTNLNEPENQIESIDAITAFHCKTGLSFNQDFFNRKRCYGWPRQSDLDKMKGQGCLLVPTGHSRCERKYRILQWRISFSFQERHIMLNLNDAQHKCYILLKLVKRSHISPDVGLTSYHCKTALFYTIENTPSVIWSRGNLLTCFLLCIKRIKMWSRNYFCPNYFLPELNLFTGKIENREMHQLTRILSSIIKSPMDYLQKIPTDNFGKLVHLYTAKTRDDRKVEEEVDTNVANKLHKLIVDITNSLFRIRSIVLQKITYRCSDLDEIIQRHFKWLDTIKSLHGNNEAGPYQLDGVKWVLPHVCKFLHTSLASHLAIKALETKEIAVEDEKTAVETEETVTGTDGMASETEKTAIATEEKGIEKEKIAMDPEKTLRCWLTLSATYHYWMGLDSDAMSGKMKLATFLLYTGYLDMERFKANFCPVVDTQSLCDCTTSARGNLIRENDYAPFIKMFKLSPLETLQMSTSKYIEKYVSACTIFLPTESKLTFYPLQFEMHRGFGSTVTPFDDFQQTNFKMSNREFDNCATLDSKVYGILLTVLLSDSNEERERNNEYLQTSSIFDSLAHRETTFNILGWFASAERIKDVSLYWYKQSWDYNIKQEKFKQTAMVVYDKNAAKWHLVLLLFRAWMHLKTGTKSRTRDDID